MWAWTGAGGVARGRVYRSADAYAFERRRFWLSGDGAALDAAGLGLGASEHALLGAVVELPDSGGVMLTGRLSAASQGWLSDHAVDGVVVFPGAGFVELAIRAGDEVGCSTVDELTLHAPLMLSASGSVAVQVVVGPAEESGQRNVSVFSRADDNAVSGWMCHATGQLSAGSIEPWRRFVGLAARGRDSRRRRRRLSAIGVARVRVRPGVPRLDRAVAPRRRAVRVRALPDAAGGCRPGFGVHPVLLRTRPCMRRWAMRPTPAAAWPRIKSAVLLAGVSLHAAGASAVRALIAQSGPWAVSVELAVGMGLPVLSVASMVARPVSQQQLMAAVSGSGGDRLFELVWSPASPASHAEMPSYDVFEVASAAGDPVVDTYECTHPGVGCGASRGWPSMIRGVLGRGRPGAQWGLAGEDVTDLAGAAVWGLVRSAQTEHPGRIVLVDSDAPLDDTTIASALAVGEPQVLVRGETVYTARVHGSRAVDSVLVPPGDGPWRLGLSSAGTFENLQLEPVPNAGAPLEAGQVRVALRAIATNFRDVMIILGMFTHDALTGGEGAGVVRRGRARGNRIRRWRFGVRLLPGRQRHPGCRRCPASASDAGPLVIRRSRRHIGCVHHRVDGICAAG